MEGNKGDKPGDNDGVGANGYCPAPFTGFVFYGHKGGNTWEVEQYEYHKCNSSGNGYRGG